jgi:uncharacterized membrane protein YgcG
MSSKRAYLLAATLAVVAAACTDSRREAETNAPPLSSVQQPFCLTHTLVNVAVVPGTYHWEDPGHLLNSAEGFGPQVLGLSISSSVNTASTSSTSYTPTDAEISAAAGYDVSLASTIQASTTVLVPFGGYKRVEAFASYKWTVWDILDTNCDGPDVFTAAAGSSFKPVGVYFKVCTAYDCSLGGGQVGGDPLPSGPPPVSTSSGAGGAGGSGGSGGSGSGSSSSSSSSGTGGP